MLTIQADLRRHRLVATFLHECLGLGLDEVGDEVMAVEEAVSERVLDRLDEFLGRPLFDLHGQPIPGRGPDPREGS